MLEMLTPMKAKLIDYKTLSKKNRPADEKPGVKLTVEQQLSNSFLDHFDPKLKVVLFEKTNGSKAAQASLEGVPEATDAPNLTAIGQKLGKIAWHHDMTGYAVNVIRGLGASKAANVALDDAILCNWRLTGKEGGTIIARYDIEAGNVPGDAWETFAELKSREFDMTAKAPEVTQQSIEDRESEIEAAASRAPGAAERAAVAKVKGGKAPAPTPKPSKAKLRAQAESAFNKPDAKPAPVVTTKRPARTARGAAATKAFLEAQAREQGAQAGAGDE